MPGTTAGCPHCWGCLSPAFSPVTTSPSFPGFSYISLGTLPAYGQNSTLPVANCLPCPFPCSHPWAGTASSSTYYTSRCAWGCVCYGSRKFLWIFPLGHKKTDALHCSASVGAGNRDRTGTGITTHRILSPGRLPVPPLRRIIFCLTIISFLFASVNPYPNKKGRDTPSLFCTFINHYTCSWPFP